jgi:hypothetical protein
VQHDRRRQPQSDLSVGYLGADPPPGRFAGEYSHRPVEGGVGHNLRQQASGAFAEAVLAAGGTG